MKYIISENRFNRIVDEYLNRQLGNLSKQKLNIRTSNYLLYYNKYGTPVLSIDDYDNEIGVSQDLWDSTKHLFNLSEVETDEFFLRWIKRNMGLNFEKIYTVEF